MEQEKKSIFNKFFSFIGRSRKEKEEVTQDTSRFKYFLLGVDRNDEAYYFINYCAELCEESLEIVKRKLTITRKIDNLNKSIADVEYYSRLSEEDEFYLKNALERIVALSNERKSLMYQVTGFDRSLINLIDLEQEAIPMVKSMEESERMQRLFRQDVNILEGEKTNLENERVNLVNAKKFMHRFSIVLLVIFTALMLLLAFLAIFAGQDIFFPIAIMVVMVIVFGSLIYFLRIKMKNELAMNIKKQQKAIALLNKKSVLYAYHTNFLKFACKKYQVRNSQVLQEHLQHLKSYKHLTGRLDSMTNIIYQTERELDAFLKEKGIANSKTTLKFAKTLNIEDKRRYYNELVTERDVLKTDLTILDSRYGKIWDILLKLNKDDKTEQNLIDKVIRTYLEEVSKYIQMMESMPSDDGEFDDEGEEI